MEILIYLISIVLIYQLLTMDLVVYAIACITGNQKILLNHELNLLSGKAKYTKSQIDRLEIELKAAEKFADRQVSEGYLGDFSEDCLFGVLAEEHQKYWDEYQELNKQWCVLSNKLQENKNEK